MKKNTISQPHISQQELTELFIKNIKELEQMVINILLNTTTTEEVILDSLQNSDDLIDAMLELDSKNAMILPMQRIIDSENHERYLPQLREARTNAKEIISHYRKLALSARLNFLHKHSRPTSRKSIDTIPSSSLNRLISYRVKRKTPLDEGSIHCKMMKF